MQEVFRTCIPGRRELPIFRWGTEPSPERICRAPSENSIPGSFVKVEMVLLWSTCPSILRDQKTHGQFSQKQPLSWDRFWLSRSLRESHPHTTRQGIRDPGPRELQLHRPLSQWRSCSNPSLDRAFPARSRTSHRGASRTGTARAPPPTLPGRTPRLTWPGSTRPEPVARPSFLQEHFDCFGSL